jgi:glycosyltransferase involved in cell wall biosynthesis
MTPGQKVAVVLPVFNAERTIAATLRSIMAQTHGLLDIIVVDDGSTDTSLAIVAALQAADPRIRCIRQANAGAAAARNAGAALADAPYLAFCDADDLWAPRKIELQLHRMQAGGARTALVYCWFARIDASDHVLAVNRSRGEGDLLATLLRRNVIGNGSSPLFRKTAFDAVGGFSARFSPAEDLAIYLATAELYDIGVVNEVLVGYRVTANSLSSDGMAVYAATALLIQAYAPRYPKFRHLMTLHLRGVMMWQIAAALQRREIITAVKLLRHDPGTITSIVTLYLPQLVIGLWRGTLKDSWLSMLRRRRRETFTALLDAACIAAVPAKAVADRRLPAMPDVPVVSRHETAR